MAAGMEDKLWFVNKIDCDTIVDFGCADGALLKCLADMMPSVKLIGIDNSKEMRELAKENVPTATIIDLSELDVSVDYSNSILVLSSVIHEIFAYNTNANANALLQKLFALGFKYIAIRDMFLSKEIECITPYMMMKNIYARADKEQIESFERIWGPISWRDNAIHYLLKYKYTENWDRELFENYFPLRFEDVFRNIPNVYKVAYKEHYILPYIQDTVLKDFNVLLTDRTHGKILLRRTN
jgi:SAM-dependent methyltransferase